MKTEPFHRMRPRRNTKSLLLDLLMAVALLVAIMVLTNCGGTFVLSPDGSLSYTTPKAIPIRSAK